MHLLALISLLLFSFVYGKEEVSIKDVSLLNITKSVNKIKRLPQLISFNENAYHSIETVPSTLCDKLPAFVYQCQYNFTCIYGQTVETTCVVPEFVACTVSSQD